MKNIIFDFDSTLIKKESLELILEPLLQKSPEKLQEIEYITNLGMQGDISFKESLLKRLSIVRPTKDCINNFINKYCPNLLTDNIKNLIQELQNSDYKIWIFSGGLTESIQPFANYLNIPKENIFAVNVIWNSDGSFKSLDNNNGACDSKVIAFEKYQHLFKGDIIVVGDGYTDYQLYEKGYASKFIAYVEHVKRKNVLSVAKYVANNVTELSSLIA